MRKKIGRIWARMWDKKKSKYIHVKPGESIRAAIEKALEGDTIILDAGFFTSDVGLMIEKPVHLAGVDTGRNFKKGEPNDPAN